MKRNFPSVTQKEKNGNPPKNTHKTKKGTKNRPEKNIAIVYFLRYVNRSPTTTNASVSSPVCRS